MFLDSSMANCAAIPIPSSAPSVVPTALTHPSSIQARIGSFSKLNQD